jgi:acetyl esterase
MHVARWMTPACHGEVRSLSASPILRLVSWSVRIGSPLNRDDVLPIVMFLHDGVWMAGGIGTHDRLIREIGIAAHAPVVLAAFDRAPEFHNRPALEEAFALTAHAAEHAGGLNLDGTRLAVAGDGADGTLAVAVIMLCK